MLGGDAHAGGESGGAVDHIYVSQRAHSERCSRPFGKTFVGREEKDVGRGVVAHVHGPPHEENVVQFGDP